MEDRVLEILAGIKNLIEHFPSMLALYIICSQLNIFSIAHLLRKSRRNFEVKSTESLISCLTSVCLMLDVDLLMSCLPSV